MTSNNQCEILTYSIGCIMLIAGGDKQMKLERIRHNWHENAGMSLNRPDGSGDYVLLHFLSPVILWYDGQKREIPSGSLIVFSPGRGHGFYSEGPLLHDWMHMTGDVEDALGQVGLKTDTLYHMAQSLQITERIARLEAEFFAQNPHWERCIETLLNELWITIARQASGAISQPVLQATADHLRELRAVMIQHPEWPWTNEMMASRVNISVSRLYPLYRRLFSISPGRDLILMRVEKAKNLLAQGVSVAQVTDALGYGSTFHFIRQFKQETGVTPGKWAK